MTEQDTQRTLREWSDRLVDELGMDDARIDIDAILSLAAVAAHSVVRPAAPVTTYIVGYAAGLAAANGTASDGSARAEAAGGIAKRLARDQPAAPSDDR